MTSTLPSTTRPSTIRTFLIADIRGWTRFTRELGDEAASRLAAKFAQVVGEGVEAWGGALLELRGDEAMCAFESARRALRCAVELQEAFADESALAPELPLRVGIGLDAGEAVPVGEGYRGTALNVAARLCSTAAAGEVIATASLAHLAGQVDGLAFAELEPKAMKGFDVPVAAVLVDSATPHEHEDLAPPAGPGPTPPLPAELDAIVPLVGRDADLRWLAWHWRRARHGHGGLVAVSGSPGMGRTRLAAELAALAHRDGASVAYGPGAEADLVVVDDAERLPDPQAAALGRFLEDGSGRRLVVLTAHGPLPAGLAPSEERHRQLGPIDLEAVVAVARLYLDDPDVDVPAHLLHEESRGVPAAVHRVASQWAGAAAKRRLGESARRTSRERRDLRAAEADMIGDVERLELTRERTRLFVTDARTDAAAATATVGSVCPYKGLATFEATDADYYFGRERLVAELIARMVGSAFVGLIGASGSGKSSALQAGLLPALAGGVIPGSDEWIQVQVRPGEHPMQELRRALRRTLPHRPPEDAPPGDSLDAALMDLAAAQRLLLVVDQFEELFTSVADEDERAEFIQLLTEERPRTKVLVAVRADHYERCAAYPRLAALIGANQVLVGPLSAAEIAAIIRHPAERVGLRVEPELVEALVADIGTEPGGLPLLSTALLELWEARDGDRLTLSAYRTTGGVRGAVARLAESVYARLDADQQAETRSIFIRLAGETDDGAIVRRRVPLEELDLAGAPTRAAALRALTHGRLLTASEGYVEVAHEALLREWPRLRSWMEEDSSGRQLRLHLMSAARAWEEGSREDGDLYRGARLAAVLDWSAEHDHELNAVERGFLAAGRSVAEAEASRERRINRRLRVLLAGATVFLIAAMGAGASALLQANAATEQAARAEAAEVRAEAEAESAEEAASIARARELAAAALAFLDEDPGLSKLLALASARSGDLPIEVLSAIHQAWAADRIIDLYEWPTDEHPVDYLWLDRDPTGSLIVASEGGTSEAGYIEVVDWRSDEVLWTYETGQGSVVNRAFFADGGDTVVGGVTLDAPAGSTVRREDLGILVWDARTGEIVERHDLGPCGGIAFGATPTHLLVWRLVDDPGTCFARDPLDDRLSVEWLNRETGESVSLAVGDVPDAPHLSGDGRRIALARDGKHVVLDARTGETLLELDPSDRDQLDSYVRDLNSDGSLLLYGDRPLHVVDVGTGETVGVYAGHAGEVWEASFAPDGESVYSAGRDSTLQQWSSRRGEQIAVYPSISFGVVVPGNDGLTLVADPDRAVGIFVDSSLRGEMGVVETCNSALAVAGTLRVAADRAILMQECDGAWVRYVLDVEAREVVGAYSGAGAQSIAVSPDGTRFVSQEYRPDGLISGPVVRDGATGELVVELEGTCAWDDSEDVPAHRHPGCQRYPNTPFGMWNWRLVWSPDGATIVAFDHAFASRANVAWDAHTGELIFKGPTSFHGGDGIFLDDATRFVSVSRTAIIDRDTRTWDVVRETSASDIVGDALVIGASPDETTLYVLAGYGGGGGGALHWIDADTLRVRHTVERIHEGSPKAATINPAGTLIATGASDGFVRVWDVELRSLVHEFRIGQEQVQGLAFVSDNHLMVMPESGHVYLYTTDPEELLEVVRSSVIRGFTDFQCQRFFPDGDCPTLEELRGETD